MRRPPNRCPAWAIIRRAVALYASIVTALLKRERTGRGGRVHTSLLANGLWSASCIAQAGFAGGSIMTTSARPVQQTPAFARNLYETRDLRWLQFNMVRTQPEMEQLLKAVGLGGLLEDERFATAGGQCRAQRGAGQSLPGSHPRTGFGRVAGHLCTPKGINASRMGVVEELVNGRTGPW